MAAPSPPIAAAAAAVVSSWCGCLSASSQIPKKAAIPPPTTPVDQKMDILLVEDNADSRGMLKSLLELDGHQVAVAEDGQQGLEAILRDHPQVGLIDIGLPKMDGYQVAREARKHQRVAELYLIALTGYGQDKDRQKAFSAGFDEHLVKPVHPNDLSRVLARAQRQTNRIK